MGPLFGAALFALQLLSPADAILGSYWTANRSARIEVFMRNDMYAGRVEWRDPERDASDQPPVGTVFMRGFRYDPNDKEWVDGELISPFSRRSFEGKLWLEEDGEELVLRGFVGVALLGKTRRFTRVENAPR